MITGFEEQTKDLTAEEKRQARFAWQGMQAAFHEGRSITAGQIATIICSRTGVRPGGPRIRKMINWMHISGHLPGLIADSNGYRRAQSRQELESYLESLASRISAIRGRYKATERDIKNLDQGDLF